LSTKAYAVVDTGPLVSAAIVNDPDHKRAVDALSTPGLRLVISALIVAEVLYLVGHRFGPSAEARFLAGLGRSDIRMPHTDDWSRIAELDEHYRDFPLGGVDASVVTLAERLNTDLIVTFDRRHFLALRPRHVPAFRLLPE
jgi:hypothetical protein